MLGFRLSQRICILTSALLLTACAASDPPLEDDTESTDQAATSPSRPGLGINLNGVSDWSTQFPFLNLTRQSRWWRPAQTSEPIYDVNGHVTRLPANGEVHLVFITARLADVPSEYRRLRVRYRGAGSLVPSWSVREVSRRSAQDYVVELAPTNPSQSTSFALRLAATSASDPVRDITIVPETRAAAADAGEIFNPAFVALVDRFPALRFMDWMHTNDSRQARWSDRPQRAHMTWRAGVPLEIMVALANRVRADVWFNMPHLSDANYWRQFATHVRDNLAPGLRVYVEYSNEVWNFQFAQSQYAITQARALWGESLGNGWVQFNGMKAAQICDVWKGEVFRNARSRVSCVIGMHTGWEALAAATVDCPAWGGGPCYRHGIDAIAVTGYFRACLNARLGNADVTAQMRPWFSQSDRGLGRAFEQARDGRHLVGPNGERCEDSVEGQAATYDYFRDIAVARGLAMVAYEGGQHITSNGFPNENDPNFVYLHTQMNRDARMRGLYARNFELWRQNGGGLFFAFTDIGSYGPKGSWGALEAITQTTSPKWQALLDELARTPQPGALTASADGGI